jgi:hypothetical protein
MGGLKRIKSDMTYGQDIAPFGDPCHKYYSFDLTAATDRLPSSLMRDILRRLFGKAYAHAWHDIMVKEPFEWKTGSVSYAVGQPMGLYSSWAMLAWTHHILVKFAALKVDVVGFEDYRLLGDDIVIRHDVVAEAYKSLIKSLGVEISEAKTMESRDSFEFAKRLFIKGDEVTGFPLAGMMKTSTSVDRFTIL